MDLTKNNAPLPTLGEGFDDEQSSAVDLQAIQEHLSSSGVELTQEEMITIVDGAIALEKKVGRKSKIWLTALVVSLAVSTATVGTTLGLGLHRGDIAHHGREHPPFMADILAVPEDEEHRILVGTIGREDVEQAWLDALDGVAILANAANVTDIDVDASEATRSTSIDGSFECSGINVGGNTISVQCDQDDDKCSIFITMTDARHLAAPGLRGRPGLRGPHGERSPTPSGCVIL